MAVKRAKEFATKMGLRMGRKTSKQNAIKVGVSGSITWTNMTNDKRPSVKNAYL